ncbi:Tetratricopeptide repeat protein [Aquisphaera giovannonii]|uniref:Tetratricopeptide repeat protein n=1 Tax=Aquisphaera giovannonii TaxID=406548 RepID=A0A5B9W164_9BACT|nr:tetratricopeptide repeat protein [Aquisphaera giovannonii]QEH33700.1 Tetratricopeptide repeat protein [Aquisphaera giovannonii]
MSRTISDRIRRRLHEAEGYLELDLPEHALQILESRRDWPGLQFEACLIHGESLRRLNRHREAITPLELATRLRPDDTRVALALGWCFKRSNRLAQAIDALDRVRKHHPDNALILYNLACYWTLAGNTSRAIEELRAALRLEPDLRSQVVGEADFQRLRGNPDFESLVMGPAPRL